MFHSQRIALRPSRLAPCASDLQSARALDWYWPRRCVACAFAAALLLAASVLLHTLVARVNVEANSLIACFRTAYF